MTTEQDLQTRINGNEYNQFMFVDLYDEDKVWVSLNVAGGHTHITITKEGAKDMIAALIRIVNDMENVNGNS
jgi:hypothetical protein